MFDGSGTPLDITTLIVAISVIIVSVACAQLALMGIVAYLQRKKRKSQKDSDTPGGEL